MVSEFRRKKYIHVYYALFDANKSGILEKKDFELSLEKVAKLRGWKPGDITYDITKELMMQIWDGLQKDADSDGDGQISIDEWVTLWDKYSKNQDAASDWQKLYCRAIFQLEDAGNDGAIDCDEFVKVFETIGLDKHESIDAFKKIAKGKDKVTWEDFQVLWKEYFTSEEPSDPGNYIFGKAF